MLRLLPKSGVLEDEVDSVDWMAAEYLTIEIAWPSQAGLAYERAYNQLDAQPFRIDALAPGRCFARLSVGDVSIQQEVEVLESKTAKATFRLR